MSFYTIKEAIRTGHRLKLSVAEGEYLVEPHVLGRNSTGKTLLRAYQVRGPNRQKGPPWKVFDLEKVRHVSETRGRFENPRPGYTPDDPAMKGGIIEQI